MITRSQLRSAGVTFHPGPHVYVRDSDGKELQGITGMIQSCLFPDEYAAVPSGTLNAKAQWGTERHREIQDMIVFDDEPSTPAQLAFASLMQDNGLTPIASEYTVTDGDSFASNIDVVCDDCSLIDIKTCASLNREKVSWQLSIYAMMLEHVNPGLKAGRLFAAWIPKTGAPRLVEVPRRDDDDLRQMMQAWISGEPYAYNSKLDHAVVSEIIEIKYTMSQLDERLSQLQAQLMQQMAECGERSYKDAFATISYKDAATTSRFDSKAFAEADPDTYAKYVKTSKSKPTLSIRLR